MNQERLAQYLFDNDPFADVMDARQWEDLDDGERDYWRAYAFHAIRFFREELVQLPQFPSLVYERRAS